MLRRLLAILSTVSMIGPSMAQTIYPIDRAEILAGARFDFKVELPAGATAGTTEVTIDGRPATDVLGLRPGTSATPGIRTPLQAEFIEAEDGGDRAAYWLRGVSLPVPGTYTIVARHGAATASVRWEVFATPPSKARNVILFIGDGLSNAHRVAARVLSKGITEGRYGSPLAMDDMPHMALVATTGMDSIIPDSASTMSAYTTGHKTCTGAMGVYCARNKDDTAHPKVETLASLARRLGGKAIGIVTNTEIQDATPAAMVAHNRRRRDYDGITAALLEAAPEVVLGGGSAGFLPGPHGRRRDNVDYLRKFEGAGYRLVATAGEMSAAASDAGTRRLLGLFNTRNMDGALDRMFLGKGTVSQFPEQPDLVQQMQAALDVLGRSESGFLLMVESGLIDKYTHAMDWERAVYDTIMLDNAVRAAKAWAGGRDDTLIVVVPDHAHPVAIIGTYDDARPGGSVREKLGIYGAAGFPNYPPPNAMGYPPAVDVSRRIAFTFSAFPDHCDAGQPFLVRPNRPGDETSCNLPGAVRRVGNLPASARSGVHSAEDALLTAVGPGSELFRGSIDNTNVFRILSTALGLGQGH
jgi:alkaline phosphatase